MSKKKLNAQEEKKEVPAVNWKVAADLNVIGERTELKTFPGYWVQVRRWSKRGQAEVQLVAARRAMKNTAVRREVVAAQEAVAKSDTEELSGVISEDLKSKITDAIASSLDANDVGQIETKVAEILYGIHAHNFFGEPQGASKEWVESLIEYRDIFDEIHALVKGKNLPLQNQTQP